MAVKDAQKKEASSGEFPGSHPLLHFPNLGAFQLDSLGSRL